MTSHPLLSICIPTYNREGYLRECLASIEAEGPHDQLEVVVSDNASTDHTLDVLEEFQGRLPIRWFVQACNVGADRNFSAVVAESRGDYVWLLGDDDIVTPGSIAAIKQELRTSRPMLLQLGYIQGDSKLAPLRTLSPVRAGLDSEGYLVDIAKYIEAQPNISLLFAFISSFVFQRPCWTHDETTERWHGSNYVHLYQMHSTLAGKATPRIAHLIEPGVVARGNIPNLVTMNIGGIMWLDARTLANLGRTVYGNTPAVQQALGRVFKRAYPLRTIASVLAQTGQALDKSTASDLAYLGFSRPQLRLAIWLGKPLLRRLALTLVSIIP